MLRPPPPLDRPKERMEYCLRHHSNFFFRSVSCNSRVSRIFNAHFVDLGKGLLFYLPTYYDDSGRRGECDTASQRRPKFNPELTTFFLRLFHFIGRHPAAAAVTLSNRCSRLGLFFLRRGRVHASPDHVQCSDGDKQSPRFSE